MMLTQNKRPILSRIQACDDEFPDSPHRDPFVFEIRKWTIHQFILENSVVQMKAARFGNWEDGALEVLDAPFTLGQTP